MYLTNVPPYRVTSLSDGSSPPVPLSEKSSPPCPPLREVLTPCPPLPSGQGGLSASPSPAPPGLPPSNRPAHQKRLCPPRDGRVKRGIPRALGSVPLASHE